MAHVPAELLYTKSHEWVQFTGETTARAGQVDKDDVAQAVLGKVGDADAGGRLAPELQPFEA